MLTRWTPTTRYRSASDPLMHMLDAVLARRGEEMEEMSSQAWMPPVDIHEDDDNYVLTAELPGLAKDDIEISLENNTLRLSGERKLREDVDEESYHRMERSYGAFSRTFTLPKQVDADGVEAHFQDGLLTITVPKLATARPRRIAVH